MELITFSFVYKSKRFNKCKAVVGDLTDAFNKHDELIANEIKIKEFIEQLFKEKKPIDDVIQLVKELSYTIANHEKHALTKLRNIIAEHFKDAELKDILKMIREDAKILVSKLDALNKKEQHIGDIKKHIESEISDRQNRLQKIRTVLSKWKRSSKANLSGDKSKWLKDTPAGCRKRTNRFVQGYSTNRDSIYSYNDYNGYNSALCTGLLFSSFAVFASDQSVDNYVAQEIYSEYEELSDLVLEGEGILEGSDLDNVLLDDEIGLDESESGIDSEDAS